jgi:hypothetical protein
VHFLDTGAGRDHKVAPTPNPLRLGQRQNFPGEAQGRIRRKRIGVLDERKELQHMGTPRQLSALQTDSAQRAHFRLLTKDLCMRVARGTLFATKSSDNLISNKTMAREQAGGPA